MNRQKKEDIKKVEMFFLIYVFWGVTRGNPCASNLLVLLEERMVVALPSKVPRRLHAPRGTDVAARPRTVGQREALATCIVIARLHDVLELREASARDVGPTDAVLVLVHFVLGHCRGFYFPFSRKESKRTNKYTIIIQKIGSATLRSDV